MVFELVKGFFFIFMAEMGDKTQLLAMAFATKYPLKKVLAGVLMGSLLNHGLAVLLGTYLTQFIPLEIIQLVAAMAFVIFGLWTLKIDGEEEENPSIKGFGPVLTVAMAFFIGELGDKTQLTAITLSTRGNYPLFILMGTVLGMVFTSAIGIFIGSKLGKAIPEVAIKIGAALIFIFFGILGLKNTVPSQYINWYSVLLFFLFLAMAMLILINRALAITKEQSTPYRRVASQLYINTQRITRSLDNIYFTKNDSVSCIRAKETIAFLKKQLYEAQEKESFLVKKEWEIPLEKINQQEIKGLKESLMETLESCLECNSHHGCCIGNQTRKVLENMLFGETIPYRGNRDEYYRQILRRDPQFFQELKIDTIK